MVKLAAFNTGLGLIPGVLLDDNDFGRKLRGPGLPPECEFANPLPPPEIKAPNLEAGINGGGGGGVEATPLLLDDDSEVFEEGMEELELIKVTVTAGANEGVGDRDSSQYSPSPESV